MYSKEEIEEILRNKKVHIVYEKENGDIRTALGTRNGEILKENWKPSEKEVKENDNIVKYWDYSQNGWRAFNINKLIIIDILEK